MKRKKLICLSILLILLLVVGSLFVVNGDKKAYIRRIISSDSYSYLPKEAKNYVQKVYEKTGVVLKTEKNKEKDVPYLNPEYVNYLEDEDDNKKGNIPTATVVDYSVSEIYKDNLPSRYNLSSVGGKNYVTPVRDQGSLGICWTFASAGAVESHLLKKADTSYDDTNSTLISERQIDYATASNSLNDYTSEYVSFVDRDLGDGGNFYISTVAMANGISLFNLNNFKSYSDKDLSKMELKDILSYEKSLVELDSTINMPRLGLRVSTANLTEDQKETVDAYLDEMKSNIMNYGAAYVSTYMHSTCRYNDTNLNNMVIDVYNCNVSDGHAMQIIGWDDDIEYSYCSDNNKHTTVTSSCKNVVNGKGVWILKNSWGDSTPNPYLAYDSMYTSAFFVTDVNASNSKIWDNNYVLGEEYENLTNNDYFFSNTKIKGDEKLKKVKFMVNSIDSDYTIKVFKKDGTIYSLTKTFSRPGLVTIDIPGNVVVDKNSKINISTNAGAFIDKVSIFTSNVSTTPSIVLDKYKDKEFSETEIRLYSETKNVASGATLIYKLYDGDTDVSSKIQVSNNVVAENNINTKIKFLPILSSGEYTLKVLYNSNVINSINFIYNQMDGSGTVSNPYVITNPVQLSRIREDLDAYYILGNDIDLTDVTNKGGKLSLESDTCPEGFGWEAINDFSGTLDGKGHTIKGMRQDNYISCEKNGETWRTWNNKGNGLFGRVKGNATIKNLVLEDFDINCQGGYCAALVSKYIANMNDNGDSDSSDQTEYTATFENIAIKNSKMKGVYNGSNSNSSLRNSYGGGLLGYLESYYGNINISNIYLDISLNPNNIESDGYLASGIQGNKVNIQNIRVLGDLQGKYSDGSGDAILIHNLYGSNPMSVKNVISTVTAKNVMGNLLGQNWNNNLVVDGINLLNIENKPLCANNNCSNVTNVNVFNKDNQLVQLTNRNNYNSWKNFNSNWIMEEIDGISRIPVLKFMSFEYTSISDIVLNQTLNKKVNIYDYLTPKTDAAKRISFKSNDEGIVKLNEDGLIVPQKSGSTTIHVESLYDGYIKNVPISVQYKPHYNIVFDANGGTGTMDSIEVETGNNYTLPANTFVKNHYVFAGWNTKVDGSGTSYANLGQVSAMKDKETITLYAQWLGEELLVTFDADGGVVSPTSKVVRYGDTYGEMPLPSKANYGFTGWRGQNSGSYISLDSKDKFYGIYANLIAGWKENAYTIAYDANGGILNDENTGLFVLSDNLATTFALNNGNKMLSENIYEKDGYVFKEWNTKADGTGTSYSAGQMINLNNVENSTLRLYAQWEKQKYTVTFHANDGSGATKTQQMTEGVNTALEKNTFVRDGYKFVGWSSNADGTGTQYYDERVIAISANLDLYAKWEEIVNSLDVSITLPVAGAHPVFTGTPGNSSKYRVDKYNFAFTDVSTSNTLTAEDTFEVGKTYKITVWFTPNSGYYIPTNATVKFNGINATFWGAVGDGYDSKSFYINYTVPVIEKYNITFNANNGTSTKTSQIVEKGENTKLNKNTFTKSGYIFKEWNTKSDGSGKSYADGETVLLENNLELYAQWKKDTPVIKEGTYYLYSALHDKYAVDLAGGTIKNGGNIQLYKENQSVAQQWKVVYLGNGVYQLQNNKDKNYVLDVAGGKTTKGTNVQLYQNNKSDAQKWIIKDVGGGYYTLLSKKSGLALDVKSAKVANKQNIQVWTDTGNKAQKFIFAPVVDTKNSASISKGTYAIISKLKDNFSVDLSGGKVANGTNIQMYNFTKSVNQYWNIEKLSNGYYKISSSKNKDYVLDVKGGSRVRGANVQLYKYNGTIGQQFKIVKNSDGTYTFINRGSGLVLDIAGAKTANKTNLQTYTSNGSNAQKFTLKKK